MDTLNIKKLFLSLLILIFISSFVFASCGSCEVQAKPVVLKKTNSLVTTIPESGNIEGFAITSCGMCNFGYKGSKGFGIKGHKGNSLSWSKCKCL